MADVKCPKCSGKSGSQRLITGTWLQCSNCKGAGVIKQK